MNAMRISLVVGALMLAGALSSAASAQDISIDPNSFAAIAYSPSTGEFHAVYSAATRKEAEILALQSVEADDAQIVGWARNGFLCLAVGDSPEKWSASWNMGQGATTGRTMEEAISRVKTISPTSRVLICLSTDGQFILEPAAQSAQPTMQEVAGSPKFSGKLGQ